LGALTITGALALLVYAVVEAPDKGWGDPQTIALLAGSAVSLGAFVLIESWHPAPLVRLGIFRSRSIVGANAVMLVFGALPYGLGFVLTLYAQQVLGYSAIKFGLTSLVFPVGAAIGSMLGQAIVLRVGFRPVAAVGMALMGGGALILTQVSVGGSYFGDIFFGLLIFGPGVGLAFVTASIAALAGVAEHESGLASGLSNTSFQIGAALGVAIVTTVAVSRTDEYLVANADANPLVALTEGFQSAFLAIAILAGIGVSLSLLLLGRPRGVPQEQPAVLMVSSFAPCPDVEPSPAPGGD
jgi:predicted MFS family arabinose efflux permease